MTTTGSEIRAPGPGPGGATQVTASLLLDQVLAKAHPLLAGALKLAAIPDWYDAGMLRALRALDDNRDERLALRLAQFSFVAELRDAPPETPRYRVQSAERQYLQMRWINSDPQGYVDAHRRALAYREAHPDPDPFAQIQRQIYHLLIVDTHRGIEVLGEAFRTYAFERRLAVVERLLETAAATRVYLAALPPAPALAELDDWLSYMTARLAQFHGKWGRDLLYRLRTTPGLPPALLPYVIRAYGIALEKTGQYVEAIGQHHLALAAFRRQVTSRPERAFTMLHIGEAYMSLAVSARGHRDLPRPAPGGWRQSASDLILFPITLPLILYMTVFFGPGVWRSWRMLRGQDWIIARLFGTAAHWYRRADRLLRHAPLAADRVQAIEKLAHLYLTLGNAAQAANRFRTLLEETEAPLGEYREAWAQAGLGQALMRMGELEPALNHLQIAHRGAGKYEDAELQARVEGLMAEVQHELGNHSEALSHFNAAMRLYQKADDVVGATEIAERLQEFQQDRRVSSQTRDMATTTSQLLARRQYLVRFRHPVLVHFRRVMLLLLAASIILIPMVTVKVKISNVLGASASFSASALVEPDPNFTPALHGGAALRVESSFQSGVALRLVALLAAICALTYLLLGVVIIARTPLRTVQDAQIGAVRLTTEALTVGPSATPIQLPWRTAEQMVIANVNFFGNLMGENSAMALAGMDRQVVVSGNTAWYDKLHQRLGNFLLTTPKVTNLSYSLPGGTMALVYALGIFSLIAFVFTTRVAPVTLTTSLPVLKYSLANLYVYLYLALFVPTLWWVIALPLRVYARLYPQSRLVWLVGGIGLLLAALRAITFQWNWLTIPDIYPWLLALLLLVFAGVALWVPPFVRPPPADTAAAGASGDRRTGDGRAPVRQRLLASVVFAAVAAFAAYSLGREVAAYNRLTTGNWQRAQGLRARAMGDEQQAEQWLTQAVVSYDRALDLAVIREERTLIRSSRGVVKTQLGDYQSAILDADAVIAGRPSAPAWAYTNRALAYQAWSDGLRAAGQTEAAGDRAHSALADLDQAIRMDPGNADYHLWRALADQGMGDLSLALQNYDQAIRLRPDYADAHTGRGWTLFQQASVLRVQANQLQPGAEQDRLNADSWKLFEQALESFQQAANYQPQSPDLQMALGYTNYRLGDYAAALGNFEQAVKLAPENPDMILSLATTRWRISNPTGADVCAAADSTEEQRRVTAEQLTLALSEVEHVMLLRPDDPFLYRSQGQILFRLRACPGYQALDQLPKAIESVSVAIRLAPDNDLNLQLRARWRYELGQRLFSMGAPREAEALALLALATADIEHAYGIRPASLGNQTWRKTIVEDGLGSYYLARSKATYGQGKFDLAVESAEQAAQLLPQSADAALTAGLAALALGEAARAGRWYDAGIRLAAAAKDSALLDSAIQKLSQLLETRTDLAVISTPILQQLQRAQTSLTGG